MYSRKKGQAGSTKVYRAKAPTWSQHNAKEVEQLILKLSKNGLSASQIGAQLRDIYGVPDVRLVTGKKISATLAENKAAPDVPEDLIALVRTEVNILKHNGTHKHDMVGNRGQQLTEAKIQRLAYYYKKKGKLPADWKFDLEKAKLLIG